ncbi:hypothetical protein EOB59_03375 [Mesorhizobium sp. M7A.F.Ca.MR.176.00.0.0]|uniref:hypothetical protein n=1 Tax=Mesorhizobium sp. M7A.F.Ca.MR.176.00.0.0 TaxID=2496776 RepID=UPI000FD2F719|nr:hypothetical protein [Mesorhizobium sp. M7A.F.Ca.MR.176.00.0.0]RUU93356.1 hypothetical protein EOB59_03375 [Mesorhizobium sp. M7A.F.Ca.MR.176.00.0.0]
MPRDGSGIMSWPANGNAVLNTPIDSGKYNAFRADLLSDLNAARPVPAGGTGANTSVGGYDNLNLQSGNIASATATDLASSTGTSVTITGTAVITSFTARPAGAIRHLTFAAAATLTHNATSLILPGAANIVTAAGDTAMAQSLGGGNWRIRDYQRANGTTVSNTLIQPALTLEQSAAPTPTAEGRIQWDTDENVIAIGDGAATQVFVPIPASTAAGDILYLSGAKLPARLAKGAAGQTLRMNAGATAPEWGGGNGVPDVVIEDQKASGVPGGSAASGSWLIRTLNTKVRDPFSLVILADPNFTPSASGWCEWSAPATQDDFNPHQTRLFDVTSGTVAGYGTTENGDNGQSTDSSGGAPVVAGHAYRLEHRVGTSRGSDGFGDAAGFGNIEIYSRLKFWRS